MSQIELNPNGSHTPSIWAQAVNALGALFQRQHGELVTIMRQPTPVKITSFQQASASGVIGGGLALPQPVALYQCPMSQEGWINRISVTAAGWTPGNPLLSGQGQVWITGSTAGEPLFWLPLGGVVAPVQITEGRLSAIHLNPGETVNMVADSLPANQQLRFDFQIVLVQGVSEYTPKSYHQKLLDITP